MSKSPRKRIFDAKASRREDAKKTDWTIDG
jgi:hypothetical protein